MSMDGNPKHLNEAFHRRRDLDNSKALRKNLYGSYTSGNLTSGSDFPLEYISSALLRSI